MKNLKRRISVLLTLLLIFGVFSFTSNRIHAQDNLKDYNFVKQLNSGFYQEDYTVAGLIKEKINLKEKNTQRTVMYSTRSVRDEMKTNSTETASEENQNTKIINFGEVITSNITTAGQLQVYLLEQTQKGKITVYMDVPNDAGINYDLYLYRYNSQTDQLEFVDGSGNPAANYEQLSSICEPGVYVVGVMLKDLTTNPAPCAFIATNSTKYSQYEPNDKINQAKEYEMETLLKDSIDNPFDEDYYVTRITNQADYQVVLQNAPEGAKYYVQLFDSSLNFVSGAYIEPQNNNFKTGTLQQGVYLIKIASSQGYDENTEYEFIITDKISNNPVFKTTKSGKIVQLTDKAVYINGKQADMNWRYRYSINYTRNQEVDTSPMTMINKSFYKNGTYSGPQNVKSDDCIEVKMTGFSYMYFHNNLNTGEYEFYYIKPSEMIASGYYSFYVDVNTGKAIDTEWNWYARKLKMPQDLK
ncbi:hypothetical protein HMPREF1143_0060 [Peptoanaerobacter stomatis]|uniref:Peptidase C-terminal archaeal/bacterial domain-containing protein n=1 Tax=Peptoanaerobacter stomatis TaxID=796937 RepID=J5WD78_9FIRM|nr:hypothetical protein [Peptoanaerobacter stomatis]EJU21087.1 hypothetical protein HMPREF1143_0060 [Peptoanaerobacter stomatis]NWO25402.1 hypothetical protein [Peptostreptococcaceae bacterium oral taxon 081]